MEKKIVPIVIGLLIFCSCQPRVITQIKTEYVYRDRTQVDTTFIHDSIRITELVKGDTVRLIEYRDRYHYDYKYLDRTDTLYRVDSVSVEKIKEIKVEKKLTLWQKFRMWAFVPLSLLTIIAYRKHIMRFIKKLISI